MACGVAVSLVVASGCGWGQGAGLKGSVPRGSAFVGDVTLPELQLGHPDQVFRMRALPGHLLFVYFGYTNCPDICPTTLSDLRNALRRIGSASERVDAAFVTVDPYRDSASVVVPYLATFVKHGHALRPQSQPQLAAAERAFGATSAITKKPSGEFEVDHTATSYVVDEGGHILVQWDFGTSPETMAHDLRILIAQAGRGVRVSGAWARSSPAMATMGAAYLALTSAADDRLIDVQVPARVAARAEMHEIRKDSHGQMTMRSVAGIALPANRQVTLEPGSAHIMLVDLSRPLVAGDTLDVVLRFQEAPQMTVRVPVRDP